MSAKPLLIILGATASGKTKLAVAVAHELRGEIISADSRQIFRNMSIGTGKDLGEYRIAFGSWEGHDETTLRQSLLPILLASFSLCL